MRDPVNHTALAEAVRAHMRATSDYFCDKPSEDDIDEADLALDSALREQGMLRPDEAIASIGEGPLMGVLVTLESGESFELHSSGEVTPRSTPNTQE